MRNVKKRVLAVVLALCAMMSLSACGSLGDVVGDVVGGLVGEDFATTLVQGNLDAVYLKQFNEDYLETVVDTTEELEQQYLDGILYEAEYFSHYWGIIYSENGETYQDLDESLRASIEELYKEIYSKSKYEVREAARMDENSYAVKVLVDPIDIMEQASDLYHSDEYEPLNTFWTKYAEADLNAMSEEEYWAYTNEYGQVIVQMVKELLPELGYKEQKSQTIQVELVDDYWSINGDDFSVLDSYIIYYP